MLIILLSAVVFLLMFSILVSAHELGHYLFARLFNMRVSEFAVGIGRPIVKTFARRKYKTDDGEEEETLFNFRALPLGGFVKIVGMEPKEDGSEVHEPGGFYSKPAWQRIVVLLAGPVFSVIFGWFVLAGVFTISGQLTETTRLVQKMDETLPAYKAGLRGGDYVKSINGKPIQSFSDATQLVRNSPVGQPLQFHIERQGKPMDFSVTPVLSEEERPQYDKDGFPTGEFKKNPIVGILFDQDLVRPGIGAAMVSAAEYPVLQVKMMVQKITKPKVILENSTGVVGMAVITKTAVENGMSNVFLIAGLISISLGIFNLLPIGMLDGGQIFMTLIEILRGGKRLSIQNQTRFVVFGMILVAGFFVFRIYKDMFQYVLPGKENLIIGTGKKTKDEKKEPAKTDSNAPVAPVK